MVYRFDCADAHSRSTPEQGHAARETNERFYSQRPETALPETTERDGRRRGLRRR